MTAKPAKSTSALVIADASQGASADASNPQALRALIESAFNYRGDITITQISSGQTIEGYLFDRTTDKSTGELVVRLIPKDTDDRVVIKISDIQSLVISGKDTASGKTFENWIKKYAEKKLAGEAASIESESLD